MGELRYEISPEIFQRFPGYVRGVVVAHGVTNGPSPDALVGMLREAEASVRGRLTLEGVADHPGIKSWREAYRSFGAKWTAFRQPRQGMSRMPARRSSSWWPASAAGKGAGTSSP